MRKLIRKKPNNLSVLLLLNFDSFPVSIHHAHWLAPIRIFHGFYLSLVGGLRHSHAEVVLIHGRNHHTVPSALRAIKLKTINRSLVSFEASRWTLIPHFCREFSLHG